MHAIMHDYASNYARIAQKWDNATNDAAPLLPYLCHKRTIPMAEIKLEYKRIPATFEVKAGEDGKMLHIVAYGAGINNIDRVGDEIAPTAFDNWLRSEDKALCQFCYQHNYDQIIGKFDYDAFRVDDKGLLFEADLLPTSWGKDAEVLIKEGILKEFSIGYYPMNWHWKQTADGEIRVLDEIALREISIVTIPANPEARLVSAKNAPEQKDDPAAIDYASKTDEELDEMARAISTEQTARLINNL